MPRQLKPQKVDRVMVGSSGIGVDIMLDRNRLDFFAQVELEEVRAPTAEECKLLARKLLQDWKPQEWEAVIRVEVRDPSMNWRCGQEMISEGFTLEFCRFEKGRKPDGTWLCRPHLKDVEDDDRRSLSRGVHAAKRREDGTDVRHLNDLDEGEGEVEIPYSAAAWSALRKARGQMAGVRARLQKLVGSDAFPKLMASGGRSLLPKGMK